MFFFPPRLVQMNIQLRPQCMTLGKKFKVSADFQRDCLILSIKISFCNFLHFKLQQYTVQIKKTELFII